MTNSPAPRNYSVLLMRLAVAGAGVLAFGYFVAKDRVWSNLLLTTFYLLTLSLGGAVFLALASVTGAGWHVAFRRVPEAIARVLPLAGTALFIVLMLGMSRYSWHHHGSHDAGTFWFKELWLTPAFWSIRAVIYIGLWSLLTGRLVKRFRRQDESGDITVTTGNRGLSAQFLAVYAVTFSLASVDWLMALDPLWFSTIWGVYNFSGMMQSTLAVVIIFALLLRSQNGPLKGVFTDEHLHDLAKLLLGFSCFWMYIWFSQYMLIWYSNLPEETSYFIIRTRGPWGPVMVLSITLNWIVPFFVLLSKSAKRSESIMLKVAVVVLIGRWVDLYTMIFPTTIGAAPVFGLWEVAAICCLVGITGWLVFRSFASAPPVSGKDPYLAESLHYHAG